MGLPRKTKWLTSDRRKFNPVGCRGTLSSTTSNQPLHWALGYEDRGNQQRLTVMSSKSSPGSSHIAFMSKPRAKRSVPPAVVTSRAAWSAQRMDRKKGKSRIIARLWLLLVLMLLAEEVNRYGQCGVSAPIRWCFTSLPSLQRSCFTASKTDHPALFRRPPSITLQ